MGIVPDLSVQLGNLKLKNPILTASGTFGYGLEFEDFVDLNSLGGIVLKGLSLEPSKGNPLPRILETHAGMLNAIGLENIGYKAFLKHYLPELKQYDTAIIANIYGKTSAQYEELAEILGNVDGIHALEVNISCPNVKKGGMAFGQNPDEAEKLTRKVAAKSGCPVIVKLSPNVTSIADIAKAVENGGANIVSLINTLTGMAVNVETRKPEIANVVAGLSGPAIKPVAIKMVYDVYKAVKIPIIGLGGISCLNDVLEFMIAGATAVQIGTMNFVEPGISSRLVNELKEYTTASGIKNFSEITGSVIIS